MSLLPVPDSLTRLRDDMMEWTTNNLKVRVPETRTINNKTLNKDIILTHEDVGADQKGSANLAKQEAISSANQNTAVAISNAITQVNSYTDQKISTEVNNRNSAISTEVNKLNNSISKAISDESTARNNAITTAKQEAISSANQNTTTSIDSAKSELKSYADGLIKSKTENIINDNTTTYTETWSSKKISGVIDDKLQSALNIDYTKLQFDTTELVV